MSAGPRSQALVTLPHARQLGQRSPAQPPPSTFFPSIAASSPEQVTGRALWLVGMAAAGLLLATRWCEL